MTTCVLLQLNLHSITITSAYQRAEHVTASVEVLYYIHLAYLPTVQFNSWGPAEAQQTGCCSCQSNISGLLQANTPEGPSVTWAFKPQLAGSIAPGCFGHTEQQDTTHTCQEHNTLQAWKHGTKKGISGMQPTVCKVSVMATYA